MSFSGVTDACKLAYLAGIVDGEGCLTLVQKPRGSCSTFITVGMADPVIPNMLKETFGGNVYVDSSGKYRELYRWQVRNHALAHHIVSSLLPHLVLKKRQAQIIKEFVEGLPDKVAKLTDTELLRRQSLYKKMKRLNLVGQALIDQQLKEM